MATRRLLIAVLGLLCWPGAVGADGHRAEAAAMGPSHQDGSNLDAKYLSGVSLGFPLCSARVWNPNGQCESGDSTHWSLSLGFTALSGTHDDDGRELDADTRLYFLGVRYTEHMFRLPLGLYLVPAIQGNFGLLQANEEPRSNLPSSMPVLRLGTPVGLALSGAIILDVAVKPDIVRLRMQLDGAKYRVGDWTHTTKGYSFGLVVGWEHHGPLFGLGR